MNVEAFIRMARGYFSANPCTEDTIDEFLDLSLGFIEKTDKPRNYFYDLITRQFNVRIVGPDPIIHGGRGHVDWFNPASGVGIKRDIEWHFWDHYQEYLQTQKGWARSVVENVDTETNKILSSLEDPYREGQWDRRGMVIGSVQSGKTGNYTGLIAKAIDAGYRLIVVITGVHNSLRSQTQFRLNEELLGYHLDKIQQYSERARQTGVRKLFSDHRTIQTLTNANEKGDFKKNIADQVGMPMSKDGNPVILVIKKNVSILKNVLEWTTSINGKKDGAGRIVVEDLPLLLIDDECDYASVNTRKVERDESGNVDPDCDPSLTNQRIRELLAAFHKSAYIGYTATPFANIFIHHEDVHHEYGPDLFPQNFILSLPQPSNYVGPSRVFGLNNDLNAGIESKAPLPLLRSIEDADDVFPPRHKNDLGVSHLPESLKEAIRSFLIVCAIRRHRQCRVPHNSMLIHVTRFTAVQAQVKELVESELKKIVNHIQSGAPLTDLQMLWENDFHKTTVLMSEEFGCVNETWEDVVDSLYVMARRITVKGINGSSQDALDYRVREMDTEERTAAGEDVPWEEQGENVICIGGDKLSRGLTLDGLTVSYYLRSSKMYDTLMQMGRWFGYRDGYEDLCRIYTTDSLSNWYRFIATATTELKNELKYMELSRKEPKEFGLKVRSHPGQLAITGAGKRRNSETLKLSFSGTLSQTIMFDQSKASGNLRVLEALVSAADREVTAGPPKANGTVVWKELGHEPIVEFLDSYLTDEDGATVVDPRRFAKFIRKQIGNNTGDLVNWTLAISSVSKSLETAEFSLGRRTFFCGRRTPSGNGPVGKNFSIPTLVDPPDQLLDFSEQEKEIYKKLSPREIRYVRPKERGLLLIYPICSFPDSRFTDRSYGWDSDNPVYGIAVSWPGSETTIQVKYDVNSVYQDAED